MLSGMGFTKENIGSVNKIHSGEKELSLNKTRSLYVELSGSCTRRYMYTCKMPPIKYVRFEMHDNDWDVLNLMT